MQRDTAIPEPFSPEDTTGLGTVRDLARIILESGDPYVCELGFLLDGRKVNIEVVVTCVDGKPYESQWKPKKHWIKNIIGRIFKGA